ncbi:MAG TPA: RNA polymerase factor sigma-54 [Gammaproteobacteria bacterium]|nr:RNA polymerase factor sigma-54 [Gammaproteobacteria bacterium]
MIKPSLQLGLGQQLTMTPQLRQALKLLQLSALELQENLSDVLASNVMLESAENESEEWDSEPDTTEADADAADESATDLDVPDFDIEDYPRQRADGADADAWRDRAAAAEESLQDYLLWQLDLARLTPTDFAIGSMLIDSIDDNGYLRTGADEIAAELAPEISVGANEVEAVLHRIQNFDPLGVGARSLSECLTLQLTAHADETPGKAAALAIAEKYLEALAAGEHKRIQSELHLNDREFATAEALIHALDPHPGASAGGTAADYVVPDVLVRHDNGRWQCRVNRAVAPRLRINPLYERCLRDHRGDHAQAPLRAQLEEARWLLRSLRMRGETLIKVASAIVAHQQDFFDFGEEAMKPLGLKSIAERLDMHESTISRVCANKWMATPRGMLEFRYFFSNAVSGGDNDDQSGTAIRARIRKLIAAENAAKPLSDNRISAVLKSQGVDVARRTVAKYRESLSIPPSHQRKQTHAESR